MYIRTPCIKYVLRYLTSTACSLSLTTTLLIITRMETYMIILLLAVGLYTVFPRDERRLLGIVLYIYSLKSL